MDYSVLLLILILTTTQAKSLHHHCNPDAFLSASGMADSQQFISLQYCLIDNCTIMRIDTEQQLDIAYTTQSHLVVTPTDGQTSMLIPKNDPELFCFTSNINNGLLIRYIVGTILIILLMLTTGYIAVVHIMFKELRNTFGKLVILYNITIIIQIVSVQVLSITRYFVVVDSMSFCYLSYFTFMQSHMLNEGSATCMIAYLAYIAHHSYKCREMTKQLNKRLYKYSMVYILGLLLLFNIFILSYDIGTGAFKHVILPNGHCDFFSDDPKYETTIIAYTNSTLNKILQVILFIVYFFHYYKYIQLLKLLQNVATSNDHEQHRHFFKIAMTIGVTIGFSGAIYAYNRFFQAILSLAILATLLLIVQQCVIIVLMALSKKIQKLCKERFWTT